MGTTDVGGVWMSDSILELWLRLLALHIEDPAESGGAATKIRDQWLLASRGYFMGCVPHGLEEMIVTEDGAALVRAAIHSLLKALRAAPSHLNKDVLNLMGTDGVFTADIETRQLLEVGDVFLDLLTARSRPAQDINFK